MMSANERNSVKKWLKQPFGSATTTNVKKSLAERKQQERDEQGKGKRKANQISKLKKEKDDNSLDHVVGSAAKPERLWSMTRYLLTTRRATMAPIVFESILFLRFNTCFWDERTVQQVYCVVIRDQKGKRLADKLSKANAQNEDLDPTIV